MSYGGTHRRNDLTGEVFGRWTVVRRVENRQRPSGVMAMYECLCVCGVVKTVLAQTLRSSSSRSCGCLLKDVAAEMCRARSTHGHSRGGKLTPTFRSWISMHDRVRSNNPNSKPYYKDLGIRVCDRWSDFENFLKDMGDRPSLLHSLDRFPNGDGNYEPGNVRWATSVEQTFNRKKRKLPKGST